MAKVRITWRMVCVAVGVAVVLAIPTMMQTCRAMRPDAAQVVAVGKHARVGNFMIYAAIYPPRDTEKADQIRCDVTVSHGGSQQDDTFSSFYIVTLTDDRGNECKLLQSPPKFQRRGRGMVIPLGFVFERPKPGWKRLTLELPSEGFGYRGAIQFQLDRTAAWKGVSSLYLSDAEVTPAAIAEIEELSELAELTLEGESVTDAILAQLPAPPKLRRLRLAGTKASRQAEGALRARMPRVEVVVQALRGAAIEGDGE